MKVAQLTITDNGLSKTENHHPGVNQPWDVALCGQDLRGDSIAGESWEEHKQVNGKVTCYQCLIIILEVKKLKKGIDF